jgi:hypothetical protein
MTKREVDIELADMANQLGVTLRRLMVGLQTGRFSEHVTEDDLVYSDKGDPLFFRVERSRGYAICGQDLPDVEKDMSTVERMSTSTEAKEGTKAGRGASVEQSGWPVYFGKVAGAVAFIKTAFFGGVDLLRRLFGGLERLLEGRPPSEQQSRRELPGRRLDAIYQEGWNARLEGNRSNPYLDDLQASNAYRQGWWDADEEMKRLLVSHFEVECQTSARG